MKMMSSEDKEKWLKETYEYLQKENKYDDVKLDYIMLYELHEEEHKEIERLSNIIDKLEKCLYRGFEVYICNGRKTSKSIELGYKICQKETLNKLKELKELK